MNKNAGKKLWRRTDGTWKHHYYKVWKDAFQIATSLLDGLTNSMMVDGKMGSWYVLLWCGENPKLVNRLRTWGEARVLLRQRHAWQTPRIADLVGVQQWCMMMIGYAMNHEDDC
jgi:hypothetical protein